MPSQGTLSEVRRVVGGKKKTLFELIFYFLLVGAGSYFVVDLLSFAWADQPWGVLHVFFNVLIGVLGVEKPTFYYLPTGILLGLMAVLLLDTYKRAQGVILWIGLGLSSAFILTGKGLLIEHLIDGFKPIAAGFGVIGLAAGLFLGGVRPDRFNQPGNELEFPEAPRRLFLLAVAIILYGIVEAVVAYQVPMVWGSDGLIIQSIRYDGLVLNAEIILSIIMSGIGLYGLYKFTSYESHTKMILIGPQRSGKSALFGGMQLAVRDVLDDQAGIKSNSHVTSLSDDIATGQFPDATIREDPTPLEINYRSNSLFPEKMTLQSIDYAGELLPEILAPVINDPAKTDGGQFAEEEEEPEEDNDGPSLSDIVNDADEDSSGSETEPAKNWEEATKRIYEADQQNTAAAIWDCIRHADRVIMTVPIDDFITPIINRGNWPNYQPIETFGDGYTTQQIREEFDIPYEENLHSYADGYYHFADEPDRASPAEYLSWYRDLAREFRSEKEFVLVGTMADWVTEDFEREHPRGLNPRIRRNYRQFCRYTYEEVLLQENVNVQDLFAATDDDNIHLLWYPIENDTPPAGDEEYRIDTSTVDAVQDNRQTLLNGAKELIERLNR